MSYFCTLFNSLYLSRGLAMYYSLEKHCKSFHLYIFAFDNECYNVLQKLTLSNATIIPLDEFEDQQLLSVKSSRTAGEYCWTCTPSTIFYCIQKYNLNHCTYIDADLIFYRDPHILLNELGEDKSILITEHRYTQEYDQSKSSGIYCVQFITFKNDSNGMAALNWWKCACIEWCFNRFEDDKFGDQKYLDDWTERFNGVHVLQHLGGGVAPWNVQQYSFLKDKNGTITGVESSTANTFPLIFYHFHDFRYCIKNIFFLCNYKLERELIRLLYKTYVLNLKGSENRINAVSGIIGHEEIDIPWWGKSIRRMLTLKLFKHYKNYYKF